ncbi:MAG TPA: alpha/beta hydrolase [Anaerolineales bacterium]|nr:alpha/beta hydrolase [Anaerolineales bacterium]
MMAAAISILLAGILVLAGLLLAWSTPGKPKPFVDESGHPLAGSISEKLYLDINGVRQGMFIRGRDSSNPVLLYLHGGMPDYFLNERYPNSLEDHFTVVWWEQRGAGISYHAGIPPETMTAEQFVSDTLALTHYLRQRFGKDKIYLMGHSGGTFFGIQAAARAPELYHAYIGVAQISNQLRSEAQAYDDMLEQFHENGDTKMVERLEAAPVSEADGIPDSYYAIRDVAMHSLGVGTAHEMTSVLADIVLPSWQCRDYTLGEKVTTWRGKIRSGVSSLWKEVLVTDLNERVTHLEIPVYFLHGIYDYTVSYTEAKAYFDNVQAPVKGFYTFEGSAHSPFFEEPEKMQNIIVEDVLTGSIGRADAR